MYSKLNMQVMRQNIFTTTILNTFFNIWLAALTGMQRPRRNCNAQVSYAEFDDLVDCNTSDESSEDDDEFLPDDTANTNQHRDRYILLGHTLFVFVFIVYLTYATFAAQLLKIDVYYH